MPDRTAVKTRKTQNVNRVARPMLRDPNDEMVLEVASNGDADYIVTHNLKDFASALELGIAVAEPNEILKRLRT